MAKQNKYKIQQIVPELFPRIVQYKDGVFYDGNGNILNVGTSNAANRYFVQNPPAPTNAITGDRWYDLSSGTEFVYFSDGDSYQWVTPFISQGPQGYQGYQGPQGAQGTQGSQGYQGYQGYQGSTGPQGLTGPTGPQGFEGNQGPTGPQGDVGYQGGQGPQGDAGPTGPQGFQGNQGFQGPTGSQGDLGPQGVTGPQGFQGATGGGGLNQIVTTLNNSDISQLDSIFIPVGTIPSNAKIISIQITADGNVDAGGDYYIIAQSNSLEVACLSNSAQQILTGYVYHFALGSFWQLNTNGYSLQDATDTLLLKTINTPITIATVMTVTISYFN